MLSNTVGSKGEILSLDKGHYQPKLPSNAFWRANHPKPSTCLHCCYPSKMGNSMAVNLKKYKVLCANLQGELAKKWHFTINIHISNRWYCRIMTSIIPIPSGPKLANGKFTMKGNDWIRIERGTSSRLCAFRWRVWEGYSSTTNQSNHAGKQFQPCEVLFTCHWFGAICYTVHPLH